MPPKGMYTQNLVVLFEQTPTLDSIRESLGSNFEVLKTTEGEGYFSGPGILLSYRKEQNGLVLVDVQDHPWPDDMGDPESNPELFGAWTFGAYGPGAFPQNLDRALQQSWTWEDAQDVVSKHSSFVRIRSSYAFGQSDDAPVMPQEYESIPELGFLTSVVVHVLNTTGALCYFNPGGETLLAADALASSIESGAEHGYLPVDAWTNVRFYNLDERWTLMDSVGNQQMDTFDIEACFDQSKYDPSDVAVFIRNNTLYLLNPESPTFNDGDTIDGPGEVRWTAYNSNESVVSPPRPTLRFFPTDGSAFPEAFQVKGQEEE